MVTETKALAYLQKYFGYDSFRENQWSIIQSVINGTDTLVVMPTGGGKSLCYQLPSLLLDGLTLVISPLLALMKDQVDAMNANGIAASYFNSTQSREEQQQILGDVEAKKIRLLYVAPESLSFLENYLKKELIALVAVDEAHCISSWGHDFRPAYTNLKFLKKVLQGVPFVALTATADKATRKDIASQLGLETPEIFIASFDRANLSLEVKPGIDRVKQIVRFLQKRPNTSGIIYCLSRKETERLANKLVQQGFSAASYHAGMSYEDRAKAQENFIYDKADIMCATIAFGMGIDKSNVRWVIHYSLPKNVEGYYQEIGRAGRDGVVSDTLLFYSYADVIQLQKFTEGASNQSVQLAKLNRMREYAEATSCRRKILLHYFGEIVASDCGNCDVCNHPPEFFNGTVIAQKILSVIYRLKEKEAMKMVVDVLKGSKNAAVYDKGYQQIKTYGKGAEMAWKDIQSYTVQLLNQNYLEIAFHDNNALRLTSLAHKVLFEKQSVKLTKPMDIKTVKEVEVVGHSKGTVGDQVFQSLKALRLRIAQDKSIPAYQVFSDATLKDMVKKRPSNEDQMLAVQGVGEFKMRTYGALFLELLATHAVPAKKKKKKTNKTPTYLKTLSLLENNYTLEEAATEREVSLGTIVTHVLQLEQEGKYNSLQKHVSEAICSKVAKAKKDLQNPEGLKPYFEYFKGEVSYNELKLSLRILS